MRLLTFLPALGLAGQALAASHSCAAKLPGRGIPSDKDVKAYFDKLAPATKHTLLHETTGPEAGADVTLLTSLVLYEITNRILPLRSVSLQRSSRIPTTPSFLSTGYAMPASYTTLG